MLLFPAVCQASSVWRDPRQAEGGKKEKKKKLNEGCVRNVVGKATG